MLEINDLKIGTNIEYQDEPYTVVSSRHNKLARGGAIQQTKLKNLITGNVINKNFKASDKLQEAEIERTQAQFLYREENKFHFMDLESYEQFSLGKERLGTKAKFLKEGVKVDLLHFNNQAINIDIPPKIILEVVEAPPGVKGNTAQGGTKQVTLETGAKLVVPLFIKKGDRVKLNTETGEYVERVSEE